MTTLFYLPKSASQASAGTCVVKAGRRRLTVSKPVSRAPTASSIESGMKNIINCFQLLLSRSTCAATPSPSRARRTTDAAAAGLGGTSRREQIGCFELCHGHESRRIMLDTSWNDGQLNTGASNPPGPASRWYARRALCRTRRSRLRRATRAGTRYGSVGLWLPDDIR